MSTNTLEIAYLNGEIIDASIINELTYALVGAFVGRNASGVPEAGQSLGTAALPWGTGYLSTLILNGSAVDASQFTAPSNRLVSSATKATSSLSSFIVPAGPAGGPSFTVDGTTADLVYVANGQTTTITSDIVKGSLTLAPSTNNTALINMNFFDGTPLADEEESKFFGEDGTTITIDTAGTEITSRIGQYAAFSHGTAGIFFAFIKSATELVFAKRAFFLDDSLDSIVREVFSDNDTITILSTGWVFGDADGATIDVTYTQPVYSFSAPSSPVTGQYWYDISNGVFKRYSGISFDVVDRAFLGVVAINTADCIAARCVDPYNLYENALTMRPRLSTTEIIQDENINSVINVYGNFIPFETTRLSWNITTDLESGFTEAASTDYWLYVTEFGQAKMSPTKPHERPDLGGWYHPTESWRCVGQAYNDSSSDLVAVAYSGYAPANAEKPSDVYSDHLIQTETGPGHTAGAFTALALEHLDNFGEDNAYLNSDLITLVGGFYCFQGELTENRIGNGAYQLYNVTDTMVVPGGYSRLTSVGGTDFDIGTSNVSFGYWLTKTYEIQFWCTTTQAQAFSGAIAGAPSNFQIRYLNTKFIRKGLYQETNNVA